MNRDAAIEAGAKALYELRWDTRYWHSCPEGDRQTSRRRAAAVIDAAAPHLVGEPVGYALTWGGWVSPVRLDSREDVAAYRERTGMSGVTVALVPVEDQP